MTLEPDLQELSLREKFLKGAFWNALSQFGSQAIYWMILLVLAHLLEPETFGLVAMVNVVTSFCGLFSDLGLTESFVQKKNADERDAQTIFWATFFFSAALYA